MRAGGGKAKGAGFERKVCTALSLWITEGKQKDCFWRSAMSGGRATVAGRKGDVLRRQAGDITATSPEGHKLTDQYYVECKFYADLELGNFLLGRGTLHKFWETTFREAEQYGKQPLLIAKQNRVDTLFLVSSRSRLSITCDVDITWGDAAPCSLGSFQGLLKRSVHRCLH